MNCLPSFEMVRQWILPVAALTSSFKAVIISKLQPSLFPLNVLSGKLLPVLFVSSEMCATLPKLPYVPWKWGRWVTPPSPSNIWDSLACCWCYTQLCCLVNWMLFNKQQTSWKFLRSFSHLLTAHITQIYRNWTVWKAHYQKSLEILFFSRILKTGIQHLLHTLLLFSIIPFHLICSYFSLPWLSITFKSHFLFY